MKVFYSPYTLTPLKKANRLSSKERKHGVFLKGVLGDQTTFADYFPHIPLGDRSCDEFLPEFKFQNHEYDKKVFDLLLKDYQFQNLKPKKFFNHQLWDGSTDLEARVIKYKLLDLEDRRFTPCLEKGLQIRLDANGLFNRSECLDFIKDIPRKHHGQIEYIEDPLHEADWKDLGLPCAQDFIQGTPHDFSIYKPNCEFIPKIEAKIIFSSYLGSDFGRWHAYCELVGSGDLSLTHGIKTSGFFEDEKIFFKGNYQQGFDIEQSVVKRLYQDLSYSGWKLLCTI